MCALSVYDKRVDADTLLECMARCQQETAFNCSTLDFHAGAVAGDPPACYLRSQNRTEVSDEMQETEYCYTSEKLDNGTVFSSVLVYRDDHDCDDQHLFRNSSLIKFCLRTFVST